MSCYYTFYKLDKTGLENKYVILVDGEVVAKGEDIETMFKEVRQKYPDEIPFVAKVPDKKMLIYNVTDSKRKVGSAVFWVLFYD